MAQAIAETAFDAVYLSFAVIAGICMLVKGKESLAKKVGLMSLLLGAGDAFHLVPRVYALWTTGLEANAAALGVGKLITSVTMTVFYLLLFYVWQDFYGKKLKNTEIAMWVLTLVRIGLCALPQNQWLSSDPPLLFGILRNIPFAAMGIIIIIIFAKSNKTDNNKAFRFMPLAVALSFGFYLPVVLWSSAAPWIGMLMIPKTLAYVWVIIMGIKIFKQNKGEKENG